MALDEFKQKMRKVNEAKLASRLIYDPEADPRERAGAYSLAEVLAGEVGLSFDPTNPENVNQGLAKGMERRIKIVYDNFEEDLESLIGAEDLREGLAENVFSIRPVKTGNTTHDTRVEAHARLLRLKNLERAYKENKLSSEELGVELIDYVKSSVDAALSEERDPDNRYLPNSFKKNVKALAVSSLIKRRGSAEAYLADAIAQSNKILSARLPDEDSKVAYAKENIRALAAKGDEGRELAANTLYGITQKKEQKTLDRNGTESEEDIDGPVIGRIGFDKDDYAMLEDMRSTTDLDHYDIAA